MKTLEIHVPDEVAAKIEGVAHEKGLSVDELVRASVERSSRETRNSMRPFGKCSPRTPSCTSGSP